MRWAIRRKSGLAASNAPEAMVSGFYWRHRTQEEPAAEASSADFQQKLVAQLSALTGVSLQ